MVATARWSSRHSLVELVETLSGSGMAGRPAVAVVVVIVATFASWRTGGLDKLDQRWCAWTTGLC